MDPCERTAAEEILSRLGEWVARVARRMARPHPGVDSEDLAQEGMIAVWVAVRTFDEGGGAALPTYARIAARRRMATVIRADRRRLDRCRGDANEEAPGFDHRPDPRAVDPGSAVELRDALAKLGARQREIVRRTFGLDGAVRTGQEALAKELGISRQLVSRELAAGLRKLRGHLGA